MFTEAAGESRGLVVWLFSGSARIAETIAGRSLPRLEELHAEARAAAHLAD